MRIQLFSDLHLEFFRNTNIADLGSIQVHESADVVALAGDISVGLDAIHFARDLAQSVGKPVVYVPGNHEFYAHDRVTLSRQLAAAAGDGVHVLLDNATVLAGVRFCGGTLWTDFELYRHAPRMNKLSEAQRVAAVGLADFARIREGEGRFTPARSRELHYSTRAFLSEELSRPFEGKTVVVTHHAPHPNSIHERFSPGEAVLRSTLKLPGENPYWRLNVCFASDLTPLVKCADVWVHGHMHDSVHYRIGKCDVYANPRGYPMRRTDGDIVFENSAYDPCKLIDV